MVLHITVLHVVKLWLHIIRIMASTIWHRSQAYFRDVYLQAMEDHILRDLHAPARGPSRSSQTRLPAPHSLPEISFSCTQDERPIAADQSFGQDIHSIATCASGAIPTLNRAFPSRRRGRLFCIDHVFNPPPMQQAAGNLHLLDFRVMAKVLRNVQAV